MNSLMIHETTELNELLMSCTNSINSMGLFLSQVQCQELKSIIEKHMKGHIQDYNMKVEWATKGTSHDTLDVPTMPPAVRMTGVADMQKTTPNPNTTKLDDRAIATSYLLTLKRAGREYAWATFECANPELRKFLEDAFTMCSRHAYEVSGYMIRKGYYPIQEAPNTYVQELSGTYESVQNSGFVH
ncbi:spore coat protein [Alicyclobacillus dauci]|uniref:Spore coat protein n=1 Tax=Alicyclobacillus dauci TaxID=1475485 RepID=A0ABY6Z7P2_9BACL|nr:spore coat protein [Alicyclobacillus dauci]WAH38264.1 spore coat protein [Alicyclobacillus dauci]